MSLMGYGLSITIILYIYNYHLFLKSFSHKKHHENVRNCPQLLVSIRSSRHAAQSAPLRLADHEGIGILGTSLVQLRHRWFSWCSLVYVVVSKDLNTVNVCKFYIVQWCILIMFSHVNGDLGIPLFQNFIRKLTHIYYPVFTLSSKGLERKNVTVRTRGHETMIWCFINAAYVFVTLNWMNMNKKPS